MSVDTSFSNGLMGMQRGWQRVHGASQMIARLNESPDQAGDIARAAVDLSGGSHQFKAAAKVVEAEQSMVGTLINLKV
jgi:hypothetical protein